MLRRLRSANRPVPMVTLVYVGGVAAFSVTDIKAASPRTTVIARDLRGDDYHANWDRVTRADGLAYFEANKGLITADMRLADYLQPRDINETGEGTKINDWWQGMLDGADRFGIKLAIYQFSYGNPANLDFWKWQSTADLLRRVKHEGHAFCLHQYADNDDWSNDWTMLRHRRIYPLLPPDLRGIKLWLTECGESYLAPNTPSDRSPQRYGARLRTLQQGLRNSPGDADCAMWTLGNGGAARWDVDRLEGILEVYERVAMETI